VSSVVNRYYDPSTDQFLSIDPAVATTDQPYVFTNDNSLNTEDPLGLCNQRSCGNNATKTSSSGVTTADGSTKCTGSGAPTQAQLGGCLDYVITGTPYAPTDSGTTQWSNGATTFATIFGLASPTDLFDVGSEPDEVDLEVTFGHGARHLAGSGLSQSTVESAITTQIKTAATAADSTGSFWGQVVVDNQIVEFRAYTLPNGVINVGTYYVK
jgi:hypothetical protein